MNAIARFHTASGVTEVPFEAPCPLSALLHLHTHPIDMPCGSLGKCGKCRVRITGALSPADEVERHALREEELRQGIRLACRAKALGDLDIWPDITPAEAIMTSFTLPPLPDGLHGEGVGLAIDIGTTTLAAYLYDMGTHTLLAVRSMPNPQRTFGADVTSRLKAALEGQLSALQACITAALRSLAKGVLADASRPTEALNHAVITGNTAMLYLLTGQEPSSIAFAPFEPVTRMGIEISGDMVGLFPHTSVWLPDCISAYVGADITCSLLYAQAQPEARHLPALLADIGTNGEMALTVGNRLLTCSTAAGPAFEGAGIRFGMTAQTGAIHRVDVQEDALAFSVLGSGPALGICGSGLVDAIAALCTLGVIDEAGRMDMTGHVLAHCMETLDGQPAFRFPGTNVLLTQADVRAVQLAKSAICAGMLTLLDEAGLTPADVRTFQLAGGFGSCIRPAPAEAIGLIPAGFAARAQALGNAAGAGAAMMLLSDAEKARGTAISRIRESIELSSNAAFSEHFMDCMLLDVCE